MLLPLRVDEALELRALTDDDAVAVLDLLTQNRARLDSWLRWSERIQTLDDVRALIRRFADKQAAGDGFHAGMWHEGKLVGGLVCHHINRDSRKTELGYWLSDGATGKGLVTRACRAVITRMIEDEQMHRVELICMVENVRSRAVAERLGFMLEGVKRESEWINGAFRDHALYSLLAHEWQKQHL